MPKSDMKLCRTGWKIKMEDNEIIELIKNEDEQGLIELQEKYGSFIEYIIRSILSKYPEDMEECFNDIRWKLWTGLKSYDGSKSSLKTYISHIARNAAIDCIRKINRHELHMDKNVDMIYENYSETQSTKSAEEEVFNSEKEMFLQKKLLQEIDHLKKTDKEIFLRKYYYLQSVLQIAAEMNRSEKSIEGKLSRIRKKLKKALED